MKKMVDNAVSARSRPKLMSPSHGENRGSSPLGSANNINDLRFEDLPVSRPYPVEFLGPRA